MTNQDLINFLTNPEAYQANKIAEQIAKNDAMVAQAKAALPNGTNEELIDYMIKNAK